MLLCIYIYNLNTHIYKMLDTTLKIGHEGSTLVLDVLYKQLVHYIISLILAYTFFQENFTYYHLFPRYCGEVLWEIYIENRIISFAHHRTTYGMENIPYNKFNIIYLYLSIFLLLSFIWGVLMCICECVCVCVNLTHIRFI